MSTKKIDLAVAVAAVTLVVGGGVATTCYFSDSCSWLKGQASQSTTAASGELAKLLHEKDDTALREWLVAQGPDVAHQAVLGLDNSNDRSGEGRLRVLRAIRVLGSSGLKEDSVKAWAVALRSLANTLLHEGRDRTEFIARSYEMEGRTEDAAAEYARFPKTTEPEHNRMPAAAKRRD